MKLRLASAPSAHLVPRLVLAATVGALLTGTASAGPNAGGTLILHVPVLPPFSAGITWCPIVAEQAPLETCGEAVVQVTDTSTHFWIVYAAFDPASSPRLAGLTFGIDYDESALALVLAESCGDIEVHMNDWPAPGTGTAVTWEPAQTTPLVQVYVFAGYQDDGTSATFDLTPHPLGGGNFADDHVPSFIDPIAAYGSIGFGGASGEAPCPGGMPGACCFEDCSCLVMLQAPCSSGGGSWMGEGSGCDPSPCDCPVPAACCLPDGRCVEVLVGDCEALGGDYMGDDSSCTPDPCEPVPALESSWGTVKEIFR